MHLTLIGFIVGLSFDQKFAINNYENESYNFHKNRNCTYVNMTKIKLYKKTPKIIIWI